jgi:Xaa-Pro aminopeptidase
VERERAVKDDEEFAALRRAQAATDSAFERVVGKLDAGVTERGVALELEIEVRGAGAERLAFDPIVAFGEHSAEPHHRPCDRALAPGDVVKLDFGALVDGYHADMTRTVAVAEPAAELRAVHDVVRRAQSAAAEAARGGIVSGDLDRAAREVIEEAGYGDRYTHPLGHGVGLEIHEWPIVRRDGTEVVPAGAVVTLEPGVYLPGVGGVRIEDMVRMTPDACEPLPSSTKELVVA